MSTSKEGKRRSVEAQIMIERGQKAGPHHTRERDIHKGRSRKPKHKKRSIEAASGFREANV